MTTPTSSQVDEGTNIPASVRAAAARSAELQAQLRGEQPKPAEAKDQTQQDPAQQEPAPKAEAKPEPKQTTEQPVTHEGNDDQSWERKFNAMRGRFDKAERDKQDMFRQIQGLQALLATMQTSQPPSAPAPASRDIPRELQAASLITPEEMQEYGPEFVDLVKRAAKEVASSEVAAQRAEIERLKKQLTGVGQYVEQDAKTKMYADLDSRLPNWQEINTNPAFIEWLRLRDQYSGAIRMELLKAAYAQNDAPRVLAFFNGFLAEEATIGPANSGPAPAQAAPKADLNKFAAPGRAKSAAAPAPAEKPIITRAQITAFFADVAAGKYRGRDNEKAAAEKMIFEAQADGRIR